MRASRVRLWVAIATLLAGTAVVSGYVVSDRTWPDGDIPVEEQLGGSGGTLLDGSASLNVAFENALQTWNQYLGRVRLVPVRNSTAENGDGNGFNNVTLANDVYGTPFDDNIIAMTTWWYDTITNRRLEFDVVFNSQYRWNSYRGALRNDAWDLGRVALRQLGVGLGLGAPDLEGQTVDALMNSIISDQDTLTLDDIAGAVALYGKSGSSAGAAKQLQATTDASGTAVFPLASDRTFSMQFVDPASGTGVPGLKTYLFTANDGNGLVIASDMTARYFPYLTPVQMPVRTTALPPGSMRPVQAVLSETSADTGTVSTGFSTLQAIGSDAANSLRILFGQAGDFLRTNAAAAVETREIQLDEVASFAWVTSDIVGGKELLGLLFSSTTSGAAKLVSGAKLGYIGADVYKQATKEYWSCQGYSSRQRFQVTVLKIPHVNSPGMLREFTELLAWATPLEQPTGPPCSGEAGAITGRVVDSVTGQPLTSASVEGMGPTAFHLWASDTFTRQDVTAGTYWLKVGARDHESADVGDIQVRPGQTTSVGDLRLRPTRVRRIVVSPATMTIKDSGLTTSTVGYTATVYGADNKPVTAPPKFTWSSETPSVATIDAATGVARGVKAGTTRITAIAEHATSEPATLTVEKARPCSSTVSPTSVNVGSAGGSGTISVTTDSDCSWTAKVASGGFLSITSATGLGTGSVRYSVQNNTSQSSRTGSLLIADKTVTVTQAGVTPTSTSLVANTTATFTTQRPTVGCTWSTTAKLKLTFTFTVGTANVPDGNVVITGSLSAPAPSSLCLVFNHSVNATLTLGGTTSAMTFSGVIDQAGSGNTYRVSFSGPYNSSTRALSGPLKITYGGYDGSGQTTVTITAQ